MDSAIAEDAVIALATSLGHLPALSHELLPEGKFTSVNEFKSALRSVGDALQALSKHRGHLVLDRKQASDLILSLALVKDTRTQPLSDEFSVQSLLKLNHKELITAAAESKRILRDLEQQDLDYLGVQRAIDATRNPETTRRVLPMLRPGGPKIPTTVGVLDLSIDKASPKALPFDGTLLVTGRIVGGLDESTGTFLFQVKTAPSVEHCVIQSNTRYRVSMLYAEHRTQLLFGQLLQSDVHLTLKVDSAPLRQLNNQDLRLTLENVDLELDDPNAALQRLAQQMKLEFLPTNIDRGDGSRSTTRQRKLLKSS